VLLIIERAAGCRMWDADGTEYIDYLLGQGPNFLGHAPPGVLERVLAAQRDGVTFAATHPLEIEAAERVLAVLGWVETMRFGGRPGPPQPVTPKLGRHGSRPLISTGTDWCAAQVSRSRRSRRVVTARPRTTVNSIPSSA
jgi:hypothetical protein